ncbi:MAG: hypothetical protein HC879_03990 [Leptolyngbyaceae cyanobacterium SL_5_9]|nr:hypothetical protein [Leptolyngbyaceae cyanobacterium SL_5_9]NJO73217.1 hypothetical protein [Leptolyngbyaceae cyanobacterium RM1_406_9]
MTDNLGSSNQTPVTKTTSEQTVAVTVQIPLSLAKLIKRRASQSGQSHNQLILNAIQLLLGTETTEQPSSQLVTLEDLTKLSARLSQVELLRDRLEVLEGKWVAS